LAPTSTTLGSTTTAPSAGAPGTRQARGWRYRCPALPPTHTR
jgi:hypothetical protein